VITVEEMLGLIGNVGFPIAVSVYLLIRVESKLGQLSNAITQLREAIITLSVRDCQWPPQCTASPRGEAASCSSNPPII
jgi:hypothetical protein